MQECRQMVKWGVQLVASELPRAPGYYNKWLLRHKKSGCVEYIRTGMVQMDAIFRYVITAGLQN